MKIQVKLSDALSNALNSHLSVIGLNVSEYIRGLIADDLELGKNANGRPANKKPKKEKLPVLKIAPDGSMYYE